MMLRHLVSLLDGVLQCAIRSAELRAELGLEPWQRLSQLASDVKQLCIRNGW